MNKTTTDDLKDVAQEPSEAKILQASKAAATVSKCASLVAEGVKRVLAAQLTSDRELAENSIRDSFRTAQIAMRLITQIAKDDSRAKSALESASASFKAAQEMCSLFELPVRPGSEPTPTLSMAAVLSGKWDGTADDWDRYQRSGDPELRTVLLRRYMPLVRKVALRINKDRKLLHHRAVDFTLLTDIGVIWLDEAFLTFDPDKNTKFEDYVASFIRGAILREVSIIDRKFASSDSKLRGSKINVTGAVIERKLKDNLKKAKKMGKTELTVVSKELHNEVVKEGGFDNIYPGPNHRIPVCCSVMRKLKRPGDEDNGKRISPLLEVTYYMSNQEYIESGNPHTFDQAWTLIEKHVGDEFYTKTGKEFTYEIDGDGIVPSRTYWRIPRADFDLYFSGGPVAGPGGFRKDETLMKIQGPSYLWAIMHDDRIKRKGWK